MEATRTFDQSWSDQKNLSLLCADRELRTVEQCRLNANYGVDRILKRYVRLPTVNTLDTSAKYYLIQELVEKQPSIVAGLTIRDSLQMLPSIITDREENREQLLYMYCQSKELLDSKGAWRISQEIISYNNLRVLV